MARVWVRLALAAVLGLATTVSLAWGVAAFKRGGWGPTNQSVLLRPAYYVSFGRKDAWGKTQLYWRAVKESGGGRWGAVDRMAQMPGWSRSCSLRGPFVPGSDFPNQPQTFEVASGWPLRALRAEFSDHPQGSPRPKGGAYTTVRGIPLPFQTSRSGKARVLDPAALPYEPIWPGLLGDTAVFAAYWAALLVGFPAARRSLRARRGRCLGCGYDAKGLSPAAPCPECGAPQREAPGLARRWPAWVFAGAVMLTFFAGAAGYSLLVPRNWSSERIKPLALLRAQAWGSAPSLEEISRRLKRGSLKPAQIAGLVSDALAAQADASRPWEPRWGDFIQSARAMGMVDDEQWRNYARNAVVFTLSPRSPVRVGDPTPLRITHEARVGQGWLLGLEVSARPPALGEVQGTTEPNPRFKMPQQDRPSIAGYRNDQLFWFGPGASGAEWDIKPQDPSWGPHGYIATWPLAQAQGRTTASIVLDIKIVENAFAPGAPTILPARAASTKPLTEYSLTLSAPVEVVPRDRETIKLATATPELESLMREAVQPVTPAIQGGYGPVPMLEREGKSTVFAKGSFKTRDLPMPVAFEVYWRSGGREWLVGHLALAGSGTGEFYPQYRTAIEGFEAATVDIILRPNADVARAEPTIVEIFGTELVFPGIPVRPLPPEGPEQD